MNQLKHLKRYINYNVDYLLELLINMNKEEIYNGNSLIIPCAEVIYNLISNEIDKIKIELDDPNLTEEEKDKLKEKLRHHKEVYISIKRIIEEGIGCIYFFTKLVRQENDNVDIQLRPVGRDG